MRCNSFKDVGVAFRRDQALCSCSSCLHRAKATTSRSPSKLWLSTRPRESVQRCGSYAQPMSALDVQKEVPPMRALMIKVASGHQEFSVRLAFLRSFKGRICAIITKFEASPRGGSLRAEIAF